jgi:hypothetical protein
MFAGVMFFSMALNLQYVTDSFDGPIANSRGNHNRLVLVHGVNGQQMEKYYILGAVLLTLACNVPPYAAGALGFVVLCLALTDEL